MLLIAIEETSVNWLHSAIDALTYIYNFFRILEGVKLTASLLVTWSYKPSSLVNYIA